jgi:DNA-binding response OmpR family regulator
MNDELGPLPCPAAGNPAGPVVLFVDDDQETLSALRRCFRQEPIILRTALGSAEGLSWLARTRVDLVITDERMPGMAGTEFLEEARALSPRTGRGILTGYPSDALIRRGLEAGADAFHYKPWEDRSLREFVRGLLQMGPMGQGSFAVAPDPLPDSFDLGARPVDHRIHRVVRPAPLRGTGR